MDVLITVTEEKLEVGEEDEELLQQIRTPSSSFLSCSPADEGESEDSRYGSI